MAYSRAARNVLIQVARSAADTSDALITYSELARRIGMPLNHEGDVAEMSHMLGDISTHEHKHHRPLLSVVVVQGEWAGNPQQPGDGFFKLARQLGLFSGKTELEKITFFAQELERVQLYWKSQTADQ